MCVGCKEPSWVIISIFISLSSFLSRLWAFVWMPLAVVKTLEVVNISLKLCKAKVKGQGCIFPSFSALGAMHISPLVSCYLSVMFGLLGAGTEATPYPFGEIPAQKNADRWGCWHQFYPSHLSWLNRGSFQRLLMNSPIPHWLRSKLPHPEKEP